MKLLIITQSVDKNNPILGFFHRWIKEFAKNFEKITVICLEKGGYDLPSNVKVLSLGKEDGKSRIKYIFNFYKYIWRERKNYNSVFVHMNQEYVLLGALIWRILGRKVKMWRNHYSGNLFTYIACKLCDKIFCTSKFSYTAKFKKTVLMPVGIDTYYFKPDSEIKRISNSILFLGRIAPVKKPDILLGALKLLKDKYVQFTASFYGDPLTKDINYYESLKKLVDDAELNEKVAFHKGIPNTETVPIYNKHDIFVNLSSSGMFDKTIFEAMACGCVVLISNENLRGMIDSRFIFKENDVTELSSKLMTLLKANEKEKVQWQRDLEEYAKNNHSLTLLASKLCKEIK